MPRRTRQFLTPELLRGSASVPATRRRELGDFFTALIRKRGHPLHVANLWNALYFGYDLDSGYDVDLIASERIPTVQMEARQRALAIGEIVRVRCSGDERSIVGEIIYKEGAHPDISDEYVAPGLSGAPATTNSHALTEPVQIRERFLIDRDAFGHDHAQLTPNQYMRILDRGRWLDEHGHLVLEAVYVDPIDADLNDTDFYIKRLLTDHRDGLLAACLREQPTDSQLREALLRSFATVRDIALEADGLQSWRDTYFFDAHAYQQRLADHSDKPLRASDLHSIYSSLTRISSRGSVVYSALGPRIIEHLRRDAFDEDERALVRGEAYATAVCHTNRYLQDKLAVDQATGKIVGADVHLRLDDDWQAGGIWRCEPLNGGDSAYALLPPTLPLHLGHLEASAADETDPDPDPPIAETELRFTCNLGRRDLALGRLRLPPAVVTELPARVVVRVTHDQNAYTSESGSVDGNVVCGVGWPLAAGFQPGIKLRCFIEKGGSVITCRSTRLVQPVVIDGTELWFEMDATAYARERVSAAALPASDRRAASSLRDLISRTFERVGRRDGDIRRLTRAEIIQMIFGEAWAFEQSRLVLLTLAEMGATRDGEEFIWRARVSAAARSDDRSILAEFGGENGLERIVRQHMVRAHIRRYSPHGYQQNASAKKIDDYPAARRAFGDGTWPLALSANTTWVAPYEAGAEQEYSRDQLALMSGADENNEAESTD